MRQKCKSAVQDPDWIIQDIYLFLNIGLYNFCLEMSDSVIDLGATAFVATKPSWWSSVSVRARSPGHRDAISRAPLISPINSMTVWGLLTRGRRPCPPTSAGRLFQPDPLKHLVKCFWPFPFVATVILHVGNLMAGFEKIVIWLEQVPLSGWLDSWLIHPLNLKQTVSCFILRH